MKQENMNKILVAIGMLCSVSMTTDDANAENVVDEVVKMLNDIATDEKYPTGRKESR